MTRRINYNTNTFRLNRVIYYSWSSGSNCRGTIYNIHIIPIKYFGWKYIFSWWYIFYFKGYFLERKWKMLMQIHKVKITKKTGDKSEICMLLRDVWQDYTSFDVGGILFNKMRHSCRLKIIADGRKHLVHRRICLLNIVYGQLYGHYRIRGYYRLKKTDLPIINLLFKISFIFVRY